MRIVATLFEAEEIERFGAQGADVFLVNSQELSTKARVTFSRDEIRELAEKIHSAGRQIYVNLNTVIHEGMLPLLSDFLAFLKTIGVDGIVAFDLTVLALAEPLGLSEKVIYRPGTMNTNSYDPWFFKKNRLKGITLSKDVTLEELIAIGENFQGLEISVVGHGYLFLFYSKRPLITDYFEYRGKRVPDPWNDESFRLVERTRPEESYPIYEDRFGTHVFRSKKLQSFNELKVLRPYLDDLFVERMFLPDEEYLAAIAAYADEVAEETFLAQYGRGYDSGFYYQKTLVKKGDDPR